MKFVDIKDVDYSNVGPNTLSITDVLFLDKRSINVIYEATKGNIEMLRGWLDTIGVSYDTAQYIGDMPVYSVGSKMLTLSELSSGERYVLFLLACRELGLTVIAHSLFERLGNRLEKVVLEEFKDYDNLTVVLYNAIIPNNYNKGE